MTCPNGYNLTKNGFCMKFYSDKRSKRDVAKQQCQKDGGHLVNIDSELKYADVSSLLLGWNSKGGIWIDGHRKAVSSPWEYTYGSKNGFFKWYPGEPGNTSDEHFKGWCSVQAGLQVSGCDETLILVAKIDTNSETKKEFGICIMDMTCPNGYNLTKNGFCMKLVADKYGPKEAAEQQCQTDGGHLVNIDSEMKLNDVDSLLTGFIYGIGIWIDGERKHVSSP
ncbi:uncharacterized protein LOC132754657 [Ruditapes philippinarum]|uniref:uncharacterized protein LOC132754657 n=1 Tax=Ruditapes philippinarum TaxID=129788 RepID=UPI00295B8754|nr:uncharacterized protein LOC132754657 [Ruditapes philippinarum]